MTEQQQAQFEGWAIVDVLGHQRYVGYVTTQAFGAAVLFRVDVPALDARERETKAPGYVSGDYLPAGTVVQEGPVDGYTKLIGAGSIYTMTPCTKEAALAAVEATQHRPLINVRLPPGRALAPAAPDDDTDVNIVDDIDDDDDEVA
jgi:hypothetical protein